MVCKIVLEYIRIYCWYIKFFLIQNSNYIGYNKRNFSLINQVADMFELVTEKLKAAGDTVLRLVSVLMNTIVH